MHFAETEEGFGPDSPEFQTKLLQRRTLLIEVGQRVAANFRRTIASLHGRQDAVEFNRNSQYIDEIVHRYVERVARFRTTHGFDPDGRINHSKIAGILAVTVLESDPTVLFRFTAEFQRSIYPRLIGAWFVYRLVMVILDLDVEKIDPMTERDLINCLARYPDTKADLEWVIWSFRMLQMSFERNAALEVLQELEYDLNLRKNSIKPSKLFQRMTGTIRSSDHPEKK